MNLAPEHLEDLHKSGLTEATIAACGFGAVRPGDIKLAGVESAYRLPYFNLDGSRNCAERLKLFPAIKREDGTQKYHQAPGTPPSLYIPPLCDWPAIAADPQRPVGIAEGEKKAASLSQHGIPTIGIAGTWNHRQRLENGERITIPTFDLFTWAGRPVEFIPDSDCWQPEKLHALCGFYALAQELVSRGAAVRFVVLSEDGHGKVGVDDWLVKCGGDWANQWPLLKRIALDDNRLRTASAWWQKWRERQVQENALRQAASEEMDVTDLGGSFQIRFPVRRVILYFSRLSENARGVHAEITVTVGATPALSHTDISLKSDNSRIGMARSLSKTAQDIPWKRLLERSCAVVLERHRSGEPIIELQPTESTHVPFVINPIVYRNHQTLIFAPGGSFKSYLALYFALIAIAGMRQSGIAANPIKVLLLDYELDAETVGARLKALHQGHPELGSVAPYYRRCTQPLHLEAPSLAAEVARLGVGLVIVDSAALACGGDLNSPESAIKLQQALRRLNCASIVLAHVSKGTAEGQDRSTYGSVFFRELARNVFELVRHENSTRVVLSQAGTGTKRSFNEKSPPIGLEFTFTDTSVRISSFDPADDDGAGEFEGVLPARERIRRLLSDGTPRSPKDITDETGLPITTVKSVLSRGRKDIFARAGSYQGGKWVVSTAQTPFKKSLHPIVAAKIDAPSLQSLHRSAETVQPIDASSEKIIAPIVDNRCTRSLQRTGGYIYPPAATIPATNVHPINTPFPPEEVDLDEN